MIYDTKSEDWDYLIHSTLKERQDWCREIQNRIFDELDEKCEKKYGHSYFIHD